MNVVEQLTQALDGRYEIEREIGAGGMATVYLARDVKHRRRVALKLLKPELGAVLGVERFLAEIQVTANLQHPNLLPLFDSGEANGLLFYVMPFVDGESLRARLDRENQLPVDEAVRIATAIAGALQYAHEHGVIHRDLKPENILLQAGQPVVADFGIALAVSKAGGARVTQTGLSLGTPQYMSPEQATGDRTIDARTDIYSLAAMTYEMLTGEPPHSGTSAQAIIAKLMTEEVRPLTTLRRTVPAHIDGAVRHGLEKLAADRFASAEGFALALSGARPFLLTTPGDAATTTQGLSQRQRIIAASLAVIALGGIGTSAWLATRPARELPVGKFEIGAPDSVKLYSGAGTKLIISRDGTKLVFVGDHNGKLGLYLRHLDDPTPLLIRGSEFSDVTQLSPAFSPDAEWIAMRVGGSILKIPITGGTPQVIADTGGTSSWGDHDVFVYAASRDLYVGTPDKQGRMVASPDSAHGLFALTWPDVLPGEDYALVSLTRTRMGSPVDSMELGVVSLKDGSVTRLGIAGTNAHYVPSGHIIFGRVPGLLMVAPFSLRSRTVTGPARVLVENVWIGTGGAVAFAVSQNGVLAYQTGAQGVRDELVAVGRDGHVRHILADALEYYHPRVSPDGGRIAVTIGMEGSAATSQSVIDATTGAVQRLGKEDGCCAEWLRDRESLVFVRKQGAERSLVMRALTGSPSDSVLVRNVPPEILEVIPGAPHGLAALNELPTSFGGDIEVAPIDSLSARRPALVGRLSDVAPAISADGKLLAWASDGGQFPEVYVQSITGTGARLKVSLARGREPVWSAKGSTLFYRANGRIMSADIDASPLRVTKRDSLFTDSYVSGKNMRNWDVFPGSNEFLMVRPVESQSNRAYVMLNWQKASSVTRDAAH